MAAKGSPRARHTKFGIHTTNLRGRPVRERSEDSSEDARELERLLQLIRGRGDWDRLDARHRTEGKSRD